MTFWGKVSRNFKALGSKVAGAAGLTGAGAVAKGIGALGDFGKSLLAGTATVHDARQGGAGLRNVVQGAGAVRDAYMAYQSRSPLERPG